MTSITSTSTGPRTTRGFGNAARMGTILAGEVLRTWPRLQPVEPGRIARQERERQPAAAASLRDGRCGRPASDRCALAASPKSNAPSFLEMVQAFKVLDVAARNGRPQEVEVQVIALGDEIAWVSLPGEIFTELGLAIKQDSPFPHTIIAELANGSIGYIPSRRAYPQGNYEVVSARCARGIGRAAGGCRREAAQRDALDEPWRKLAVARRQLSGTEES